MVGSLRALSSAALPESATAEAGFSLITEVTAAVDFTRIDFVKVIVGWLPSEFSGPPDPGRSDPEAPDPFEGQLMSGKHIIYALLLTLSGLVLRRRSSAKVASNPLAQPPTSCCCSW